MIPQPPKLEDLSAGTQLQAGLGTSTVIADIDFETYSEAGFVWDEQTKKWGTLPNATKKGLPVISAAKYAEHSSTEILSLAYDLKDGQGKRLWIPSNRELPTALFAHVLSGGLIEAWNSAFEYWIWNKVGVRKYGFPPLHYSQLRDASAKARAFALPGSLANAGTVMNLSQQKNAEGKRLLNKFSMPRNPTIKDNRTRIKLTDNPADTDSQLLYAYNLQDIATEAEASSKIPDLNDSELKFWLADQAINFRGVAIDIEAIESCITIVEQAHAKYNAELLKLTDGQVKSASEVAKIIKWLATQGIRTNSIDSENINEIFNRLDSSLWPPKPNDTNIRRVLEIRELLSSAAVKKLYAMRNQVCEDGRLHDLFLYHSARTGRAAGVGPQPQNLPNSGPYVVKCKCGNFFGGMGTEKDCPWCGQYNYTRLNETEWKPLAVEHALKAINTKSLACVEMFFGDAITAVSGCLRGMFIASPGHDLICSDYSAIEAVVLAELSGEQWRQEVFRTHGMIYEMSASKITGIPFEEFQEYKNFRGFHHPMRKKVGKVAELASGYQGWIGAWKQFGADEFFNDEEIKQSVLAWRAASPMIVKMWKGLEDCAQAAIQTPGNTYTYRNISYVVKDDKLFCKLPSGRYLTYHKPRLQLPQTPRTGLQITFEGWNTNPKNGAMGWNRMTTYGGRLTENVVQAVARDILAHGITNLEASDFPVVLHIHDEIVSEVQENCGDDTLNVFEKIMSTMPEWAKGWPIKATGGWRGKRYRKD